MCEFSEKLIAWMDGELAEGEAAEVERHVSGCKDCGNRLAAYKRASSALDVYCEATFAAEAHRKSARWVPVAVAAGFAAAVAIAILLSLPHRRVAQVRPGGPAPTEVAHVAAQPAEPAAMAAEAVGAAHPVASAVNRASRRNSGAAVARVGNVARRTSSAEVQTAQARHLSALPPEPQIEISIPADAMFPPGALPPGMSFTADLTISPDGSLERMGLRPQLAKFERRTQP
jgi:negative regulator of sigma E activity